MFGARANGKLHDLTTCMHRVAGWQETEAGAGRKTSGAVDLTVAAGVRRVMTVGRGTTSNAVAATTVRRARPRRGVAEGVSPVTRGVLAPDSDSASYDALASFGNPCLLANWRRVCRPNDRSTRFIDGR